jgi:ubiquinone/menaquinone biosynthesis C-methylase UbiE
MLSEAQKHNDKEYYVIRGLSDKLPFCNGTVDMVVSRFSLPYWVNPLASLNEINRVLKGEGIVIFDVLNKNYPKWKLNLIKFRMHLRGASGAVVRYHIDSYDLAMNADQIKQLFKNAGFKKVRLEGSERDWHFFIIASKNEHK